MKYIISDPKIRGGVPVIKGTRFPVSRLLEELADDRTIDDVCMYFNLDQVITQQALVEIANVWNKIPSSNIMISDYIDETLTDSDNEKLKKYLYIEMMGLGGHLTIGCDIFLI